MLGEGGVGRDAIGDAVRQHPGLARASSCVHDRRRWSAHDRLALFTVETDEEVVWMHAERLGEPCNDGHITLSVWVFRPGDSPTTKTSSFISIPTGWSSPNPD